MSNPGGSEHRSQEGQPSYDPNISALYGTQRASYDRVIIASSNSAGAALITERTRNALLADLNMPPDLRTPIAVDLTDSQHLHPMIMAMHIFQGEIRYLAGLNEGGIGGQRMLGKEVATSFNKWGREAFGGSNPTSVNTAALGIGVVLRAFRLQCIWPFTERLATLHSGQVYSILHEDDLNLMDRQNLLTRELHDTEVPQDQPHLRYVIDRLAFFCEDELSLADGAGGAYRVIDKSWTSLKPS